MKTLSLIHHLHLSLEVSREDAGDLIDRLMEELVDLGVDDPATSLDHGEHLVTIELSVSSETMSEEEMATVARNVVLQARLGAGIPLHADALAPTPAPAIMSQDDSWELIAS